MIPFDEMSSRLDALQLDRAWLAEKSGRSPHSIRAALAPAATSKNRSELLQRALSETIEREEAKRHQGGGILPERISLQASADEFAAWDRASRIAQAESLQTWAVEALNRAAAEWQARQSTTYRNLQPLPDSRLNEGPAEKRSETA